VARGLEEHPAEECSERPAYSLPLHGHADQRGGLPRGHQQLAQLRRGAQSFCGGREVRDLRENANHRSTEGQVCLSIELIFH